MTIRLIDTGWGTELTDALRSDVSNFRIICPFIKAEALSRLLSHKPRNIRVITRFNLLDFYDGVSDISALRLLLKAGARVRGICNLHTKLYLFGTSRAIITSANLTNSALDRNHEFGLVAQDAPIIATCRDYFEGLWHKAGNDLMQDQVDDWDQIVSRQRALGGRPGNLSGLGDFGAKVGIVDSPPLRLPSSIADATQAFVKFLGEGDNRVCLSRDTIEAIKSAGCHWAVAYPGAKRPVGVKDDAIIFIARMTKNPNDIRVFGRAMAMKYKPGRDDATEADIALRSWKSKWPSYIRVHHAEFVAGKLSNSVSLNELMDTLGANSFRSTQRNSAHGKGNVDPRRAYRQQAAVELSEEGLLWLSERLQWAFDEYGKVSRDTLDGLDWPELPD